MKSLNLLIFVAFICLAVDQVHLHENSINYNGPICTMYPNGSITGDGCGRCGGGGGGGSAINREGLTGDYGWINL